MNEVMACTEYAPSFLSNHGINTVVTCTNCVQMKSQLDDALLQLKSLTELLQQDEEELKRVNHEDGEEKMADSIYSFGGMINITNERKEIPKNEC
jgi:hypothetical protein